MGRTALAVSLAFAACAHGLPVRAAEPQAFAVKFVDADSSVIWTDRVAEGVCACPPSDPVRFGHDFAGWSDGASVKSYAEIDRLPVTAAKTWTATYAKHAGRRLRVGVYSGPGANGGYALNVHRLFGSNPRIEYVSVQTNRVQEGAFMDRLDVFLIPGGTTKLMYGLLGKTGRDNIAKFVKRDGGRYFGICAGTAFQANDASGTHMGLAPFKITAQICNREVVVELTEKGRELFGGLGWDGSVDNRICYSNSPIMFDAPGGFKKGTYHFDVLATYKAGLNDKFLGRYAMVAGTNGLGRIFLTAPHPEVYESSRKFISTGVRWLFDGGVARNGATAEELRAASTGLAFTLPTNKVGRALKVAYGPVAFTERGAEELLGLVRAIDQHGDYVLNPIAKKGMSAEQLEKYDVLVVPKNCGAYSSDAVAAFTAAGGRVFHESVLGAPGVLRGLRQAKAGSVAFADIELVAPKKGETVPVVTEAQRAFLSLSPAERRAKFADKYYRRKEMGLPAEVVDGVERKTWWPKTTRLEWKAKDGVSAYAVKVVGRNGDLAFDQCVTGTTVVIDNLMVATEYDWTVSAKGETGASSFRTEDVPLRLCRFPSVGNARDLGGAKGLDGRRVKQGMIYRSMRFNEKTHVEGKKPVAVGEPLGTPEDRAYIVRRFGLKTDLDIRAGVELFGLDESPLGNGVKLVKLQSSAYKGAVGDYGKIYFKKIFRLLQDESVYPIAFHCSAGQDRTGSLAYILEALLGVDDEHLADEWAYTGFYNRSHGFCHAKFYDALPRELKKRYPAPTTRESAEAFARAAGITDEEIANFRRLMLE